MMEIIKILESIKIIFIYSHIIKKINSKLIPSKNEFLSSYLFRSLLFLSILQFTLYVVLLFFSIFYLFHLSHINEIPTSTSPKIKSTISNKKLL
jgi:hypothetical protein